MGRTRGTLTIPEPEHEQPPTSTEDIDEAVATLGKHAGEWVSLDLPARLDLLGQLRADVGGVAEQWYRTGGRAKRVSPGTPESAEDWFGPLLVLRNLRMLARSLEGIAREGRAPLPGAPYTRGGRVRVPVLPCDAYDRALLQGWSGEVWMQPGLSVEEVLARQAANYRRERREPRVAAVLGAGNVSAIPAQDTISKLYVDDAVVALKINPVNEWLGPILERAFRALTDRGFLRIVYGGAAEGDYLVNHHGVDEVHMTGSDKTFEAIVFGTGDEGAERKARGEPKLDKPITAELGNVTPVIVVPGPWSDGDIEHHAVNIATMLTNNAGFNCIAARMIVTHGAWARRRPLIDAIGRVLRDRAPHRHPYYPGAEERWQRFVDAHPEALRFGSEGAGEVPWTLIPGLDAEAEDEIAFDTEAFCGVFGEVPLDAPRSIPAYIDQAVEFCNERLWGTLAATIIIHPRTLRDPDVEAAFDRALRDLRYGSVTINHFSGIPYAVGSTPWGAYPGHDLTDIQSGRGMVHNTYLLDGVEKSVVRGPFRSWPTPPWYLTHSNAHEVMRAWTEFEMDPSWVKLIKTAVAAVRT